MGEVGLPRREYLYDLDHCDLLMIERGYERRHRHLWSVGRWHAYNVMSAIPYCDLKKSGIFSPKDLMKFPWEYEAADQPLTDEEVERIRKEIQDYNKKQEKK